MKNFQKETEFFYSIAIKVRDLVNSSKDISIAEDKGAGDYSTVVDIAVENLIVEALQKQFPGDLILAEEGHSNVAIPAGRIWIIDPICGTSNLGKGISNFCTNIALADNGKLIASCVIDHSQKDYFWSVGNGQVYINQTLYEPSQDNPGIKIDIDLGSLKSVDRVLWQKHTKTILYLLKKTDFDFISLNTSLGFAYCSVGKTDGFINVYNYPWDICAASFLIQQSGGIITDLNGGEWTITSGGAIGAATKQIHDLLLAAYSYSD